MKKILSAILVVVLLGGYLCALAQGITEDKFKSICINLHNEMVATTCPTGPEYAASDEEIEENFTRQRKLFKKWEKELKKLIAVDPNSIWADDAQYIIVTLNIEDSEQQLLELEYLIDIYPNMNFETWTKDNLTLLIPNMPMELDARLQLSMLYQQLGKKEQLRKLCEESIKKFPEKAKVFEKLLETIK